jgi:uncharacterized protein (DUF305 family)
MWKALLGTVALGWLLVTPAASQHSSHHMHAAQAASEFGRLMSAAMDKMHEEMVASPQTGDPDRDFLAMMIPHHAGAVEMARLALVYGRDPLVRQLAEEIIAGQQAEIAAMRARLELLNQGPDPRPGGFPAMSGTRGEQRPGGR